MDGASTNGWEIPRMDTTGESTYAKILRDTWDQLLVDPWRGEAPPCGL